MNDSPSEAVLAARRKFEATSAATAAKLSESAERSIEATKKSEESSREIGEKVKKIDMRVRELIEKRANAEDSNRSNEIQVGGEDDDEPQDEVALEFKGLIENFPIKPAATTPEAAETTGPIPSASTPTAAPQAEPPQQDPRWNVQAGRFGRRGEQPTPPPAAPKPPAPPKPAPRRRAAFDDDDDYENQSWLR